MPKNIYDIAKAADVSIATISRVFSGSNSVKESTRKKVLKIADEMGYHPRAHAQRLASKKKNSIMMLVPVMSNYFFTEILKGTQDMIASLDIELTILNIHQENGAFREVEQILKRQGADGYLFASLHLKQEELKKLKRFDVPISLLDDFSPDFDSVCFNNVAGGYKAATYLLRKGYRNLIFLSGKKECLPIKDRIEGYRKALAEFGLDYSDDCIVIGDTKDRDGFTEKNGYEAMQKIVKMDPLPDACFCTSDIQAVGALKAMKDAGTTIPLISYDNLSISEYIGLSTVHQPMYDMGYHAAKHLIERIDNPEAGIRDFVHDPALIIRSSSEV